MTQINKEPSDEDVMAAAKILGQRAFESIKKNGMPEGMAWDGWSFYWKTCSTKDRPDVPLILNRPEAIDKP